MVSVIDVENAQQAWGEGIVAISKAHSTGSDYIKRARLHIESLYVYWIGHVLFKKTFDVKEKLRSTFEAAV
jgi:hypothetical protein